MACHTTAALMSAFLVALSVVGCVDSAPVATDLSALSNAQEEFSGRRVIVSGTLRAFDAPLHYWIEGETHDRVALESAEDLGPWVGQTLTVHGTFFYDRESGRRIRVEKFTLSP